MSRYVEIRDQIKTGDLLAWSGGGWSSWHDILVKGVRVGTQSEFAHVGVACVLAGRVFIIESVSSGVRLFPLSRELPFYWIKRPVPLSDKGLEWAFRHLGFEYESKLKMVWSFITGRPLNGNKRFQCTELAKAIYAEDGEAFNGPDTPSAIVKDAMAMWAPLEFVSM